MYEGGFKWDRGKLSRLFDAQLKEHILRTSIIKWEQDKLIWMPSSLGHFTVSSTYSCILKNKEGNATQDKRGIWDAIWKANIHNRHQILLWKMTSKALLTLDRLIQILHISFIIGMHSD